MKFNLKFFAVYVASLFLIFSCANSDKRNLASVPSDPVPSDPVPSDPVPSDPVPSDPVPSDPVPSDPVPTTPAVLLGPVATFPKGVAADMFFDGKGELQERSLDKNVYYISYEIFKKEDNLCIIELKKCNRVEGSATNCDSANEYFAKTLDLISFVKVPESDHWFLLSRSVSERGKEQDARDQQLKINLEVELFKAVGILRNGYSITEANRASGDRAFLWIGDKKLSYLNEKATELSDILPDSLQKLISNAPSVEVHRQLLSEAYVIVRDLDSKLTILANAIPYNELNYNKPYYEREAFVQQLKAILAGEIK